MIAISTPVVQKVKNIVYRYDAGAEIILFGSRARGDWEPESDWDFLILTDEVATATLFNHIRNDIWSEVELATLGIVQIIVRNKKIWEQNLWMTPLYKNIQKEGIIV